ncbi:mitochondrial carrier [Rickenella mellea]|uniref:Mitochondrial glycine transporter n=1 Tax=Rickenella mellea TaxID=50990 RepID=A0A4R5XDA8_9AGAM|nr:mitochondrial carrier [Rickenella mellea]
MNNVGQHLLSGGLSGFASTICLQPFDLLKTRVQQRDGKITAQNAQGVLRIARDIFATEGMTGLWRGTTPTLFRNVPGVALYMTGLTQVRTLLARSPLFASLRIPVQSERTTHASVLPKLSPQGNLLAGAATRVGVGLLLNPFSLLKARFESNIYQYQSFPRAFASILRSGPSELLKGAIPSAMRDAPYAGIFVACYEVIKRETGSLSAQTSVVSATAVHTCSAASAGAIATLVTQPFDVIKTKVQVRREDRYHGLRRTVATIWQQRGVRGFFDGSVLRISRKVFSSAIGWAVYEGLLIFLDTTGRKTRT